MPHLYHKPLPPLEGDRTAIFTSRVLIGNLSSCWPWTGPVTEYGYGRWHYPRGTPYAAHRMAYFIHFGIDPGPLLVCHTCDNKICCNPHHLFLGTDADNMQDKKRKGRVPSGDKHWMTMNKAKGDYRHLLSRAKLTLDEVAQISVEHSAGYSVSALAKTYGVSYQTIWRLLHHQAWTT